MVRSRFRVSLHPTMVNHLDYFGAYEDMSLETYHEVIHKSLDLAEYHNLQVVKPDGTTFTIKGPARKFWVPLHHMLTAL